MTLAFATWVNVFWSFSRK